jgi:hypothetical protein
MLNPHIADHYQDTDADSSIGVARVEAGPAAFSRALNAWRQ